jgi:hypothetical protein
MTYNRTVTVNVLDAIVINLLSAQRHTFSLPSFISSKFIYMASFKAGASIPQDQWRKIIFLNSKNSCFGATIFFRNFPYRLKFVSPYFQGGSFAPSRYRDRRSCYSRRPPEIITFHHVTAESYTVRNNTYLSIRNVYAT